MSAELDTKIDGLRARIITLSQQPFSIRTAAEKGRAYEKLVFDAINIIDEMNAQADKVAQAKIDGLKAAAKTLSEAKA